MTGFGLAFLLTMPYGNLVSGHAREQRGVQRPEAK
jgi:hypothetical protein